MNNEINTRNQMQEMESDVYMKHIRCLEKKLLKYEKIIPFNPKNIENQKDISKEKNDEQSEKKQLQDEVNKLRENIKQIESKTEPKNVQQKVPNLQIFEVNEIDQSKVIKTIGRGAQSEVFEVSQEKHLALKVLLTESVQTGSKHKSKTKSKKGNVDDLRRLLQEYEILNILCHDNILCTYGFCLISQMSLIILKIPLDLFL